VGGHNHPAKVKTSIAKGIARDKHPLFAGELY
ncbi:unnamed protein product, partial [marine sediment metagenome]